MRADAVGLFWNDEPPPKPPKKEKEKRTPPERTWERDDYLPNFKEAVAFNIPVIADHELYEAFLNQERLVFDVESYENYFICGFQSLTTKKVWFREFRSGERLDIEALSWVLHNFTIVSFNGNWYDLPILAIALAGHSTETLKRCTNEIIQLEIPAQQVLKNLKVKKLKVNHIDLIEVAPLQASLKIYAGRIHSKRMQDLPFHYDKVLTGDQITCVRWYNINDLTNTLGLYESLDEQIKLREVMSGEYGIDLRSKSDAQVAEAVIVSELTGALGYRPEKPSIAPGTWYRYQTPYFMKFHSPLMQWVMNIVQNAIFVVGENGSVIMPQELADLKINIGQSTYQMGIGGLHSTEKSQAVYADDNHILVDRDVTSYYPFIILNLGLFPQHLKQEFLRVYRSIVERRLTAKSKAKKLKALIKTTNDELQKVGYEFEFKVVSTAQDSLKITINGSFGKLGSMWSVLYAPDLMIQVTITGQLSLLMLIERLEMSSIPVVSANTDGIVIRCPKHLTSVMDSIVKGWEQETNFETEDTQYLALFSRDVNNYIAVKRKFDEQKKIYINEPDGCKTKGVFIVPEKGKFNLQKNPQNVICARAITELLTKGTPVEKTIRECKDIRDFVNVRTVKGGAVKVYDAQPLPGHGTKEDLLKIAGFYPSEGEGNYRHNLYGENLAVFNLEAAYEESKRMLIKWNENEYLGKAIRWYYATDITGEIVYAMSGNKVSRTDGAKPCMDLPDEFPNDINYDWYIEEANKMMQSIGYS